MNERQRQRIEEWFWNSLKKDPDHKDRRMLDGGMNSKTVAGVFAVMERIVRDEE